MTVSAKGYTVDSQWQGHVAADSDYYIDVAVKDSSGAVLWTQHVLNVNGITFNGKRPDGTILPTGIYTLDATGNDPQTNQALEATTRVAVQNDAPATIVSPSAGSVLSPGARIDVRPEPGLDVGVNPLGCHGADISLTPDAATGDLVGSDPLTNCTGTETGYTFYVTWMDPFGHSENYVVTQPVTYNLSRLDVSSSTPTVVQTLAPAYGEKAQIDVCIKQASTTTAKVLDATGSVVAILDGGTSRGPVGCNDDFHYTWDGTGTDGTPVAAGSYSLHVDVADSAGHTATLGRSVTVENLSVPEFVSPSEGAVLTGDTVGVVRLPAGTTGGLTIECQHGTADWLQQYDPAPGTASFHFGVAECTPGANALRAVVRVTDAQGVDHSWVSPWRTVVIAAPPALGAITTGPQRVYPAMGEGIDAAVKVGQSTEVTATLTDAKGRSVDRQHQSITPNTEYRYQFTPKRSGTYTLSIVGSVNGVKSAPAKVTYVVDARNVGRLVAPKDPVQTAGLVHVVYVTQKSSARLESVQVQCATEGHNEFPITTLPIVNGRASGTVDVGTQCPGDRMLWVRAHYLDPANGEHVHATGVSMIVVPAPQLAVRQRFEVAAGKSSDLDAVQGAGAATTYSIEAGKLPSGMRLNSHTGHISGTPGHVGSSTVTMRAHNIAGTAVSHITIVVRRVS